MHPPTMYRDERALHDGAWEVEKVFHMDLCFKMQTSAVFRVASDHDTWHSP